MIACYYKNIADVECKWSGPGDEVTSHLASTHEVLSYSSCKHNKIILELILDLDSSGYRFVVLNFERENEKLSCLFEEYFDENDKIFRVMLRSSEGAGMLYSIAIQGKNSAVEFSGNMQSFSEIPIEVTNQCLQIHSAQLKGYSFIQQEEIRYKVVIALI